MVDFFLQRQVARALEVGLSTTVKMCCRSVGGRKPHGQCARALATGSAVRRMNALGAGEWELAG